MTYMGGYKGMNRFTMRLKEEIRPALGCTEPSAIALAVAKSAEILNKPVEAIELRVSENILKNAMSVGIPGTKLVGIEIAAALGALAGRCDYLLEVLRDITSVDIEKAQKMVADKYVTVYLEDTKERLYIKAICKNGEDSVSTIIKKSHTDIHCICHNDEFIFIKDEEEEQQEKEKEEEALTVSNIYHYIESVDLQELEFLQDTVTMNMSIANEGLKNFYGMSVGKYLFQDIKDTNASRDAFAYAAALTAAAVDARMAGCTLPVMATTGSGNQGLTASLPIIAIGKSRENTQEQILRALALSELITIHIKTYIGKLSSLCGCAIAASIGASCGVVYLLGGSYHNIVYAIKNMIADISGLICDGAKPGCALKIATSVSAATQCALLAVNNMEVSHMDGIVADCVEQSISNLGNLGSYGMRETDHVILDMMLQKNSNPYVADQKVQH
jgi:L-cysteine desulfidase